jgi:hypothetical protein
MFVKVLEYGIYLRCWHYIWAAVGEVTVRKLPRYVR